MVNHRHLLAAFIGAVLVLTQVIPVLAQQRVTVPFGTVVPLRMETYLNSESSRVGDRFTAEVFRDVVIDGYAAIPQGAKVEGSVTGVTNSERQSRAGTIAIAFDRIVYPNGHSIPIDGTLTTLSEEGRRELGNIDDEDTVEGQSRTRRAIVFIGGGAGVGAIIGAITGGGRGAAVGAGIGAVLGTIGVLLGKGDDAEVKPGTEFGMMVERPFTVDVRAVGVAGRRFPENSGPFYASPDSIRSAQLILRDRGYYTGPINGTLSASMRTAITRFQRDNNLAATGELDLRTAQALGVATDSGSQTSLVEIENPAAERIGRDSIRVSIDGRTPTGGWQVFADHFVSGSTLHVNVRGIPPRVPSSQGIDYHRVSQTINNVGGVTRVVFHGLGRDLTVEIGRGPFPGGTNAGNAARIALLSNQLLTRYQSDLNIRTSGGRVVFDPRRDFREEEVEVLFHLNSLSAAARLYQQLIGTVSDPRAVKGAADSLVRQARLVNRSMRRLEALGLSSGLRNDWLQLRTELNGISITDSNLDTDTD